MMVVDGCGMDGGLESTIRRRTRTRTDNSNKRRRRRQRREATAALSFSRQPLDSIFRQGLESNDKPTSRDLYLASIVLFLTRILSLSLGILLAITLEYIIPFAAADETPSSSGSVVDMEYPLPPLHIRSIANDNGTVDLDLYRTRFADHVGEHLQEYFQDKLPFVRADEVQPATDTTTIRLVKLTQESFHSISIENSDAESLFLGVGDDGKGGDLPQSLLDTHFIGHARFVFVGEDDDIQYQSESLLVNITNIVKRSFAIDGGYVRFYNILKTDPLMTSILLRIQILVNSEIVFEGGIAFGGDDDDEKGNGDDDMGDGIDDGDDDDDGGISDWIILAIIVFVFAAVVLCGACYVLRKQKAEKMKRIEARRERARHKKEVANKLGDNMSTFINATRNSEDVSESDRDKFLDDMTKKMTSIPLRQPATIISGNHGKTTSTTTSTIHHPPSKAVVSRNIMPRPAMRGRQTQAQWLGAIREESFMDEDEEEEEEEEDEEEEEEKKETGNLQSDNEHVDFLRVYSSSSSSSSSSSYVNASPPSKAGIMTRLTEETVDEDDDDNSDSTSNYDLEILEGGMVYV